MKMTSLKPKASDNSTAITQTNNAIKVFASTSKADAPTVGRSFPLTHPVKCTACTETHPLWRCGVFRGKTQTQRTKTVADKNLCFCCPNRQFSVRQCPKPRKCTAECCSSSQIVLLHGAEKVFPNRLLSRQKNANRSSSVPVKKEAEKNSGVVSQTDVGGLLQILEHNLQSLTRTETVLALCDYAFSQSCISETLAAELFLQGTKTKLTVHGINLQELVDAQMIQLKLLLVHSGDTDCSTFDVKPFVRKHLRVGKAFINVDGLKQQYPNLEPLLLKGYCYANIEMILGPDMFHVI